VPGEPSSSCSGGAGLDEGPTPSRLVGIARDVTSRYARLLSVKQKQLVIHDGYGNYQLQPWIDHVDYFIANVILREARQRGFDTRTVERGTPLWSSMIRTLLATLQAQEQATEVLPSATPTSSRASITRSCAATCCRRTGGGSTRRR